MALSLSTDLQNALDDTERYSAVFITAQLGATVYGFWTGQDIKNYNGVDYYAAGSLLDLSDIDQNADGSVAECTLTLGLNPEKDLTDGATDPLPSFYEEDWQFGRITIQLAVLDPETDDPIGLVTFIRGVIYEAPFTKKPDKHCIDLRIVSQSIKLSESGGIYRNNATQIRLDATDTGLSDIGSIGAEVVKQLKWGQA